MRLRTFSLSMGLLLIAAICSGNVPESQARNGGGTGAKSDILGHWAAPDCARTDEAVIFTRNFYLKTRADRLEILRYEAEGAAADHLILDIGGQRHGALRQEDGVLKLAPYPADAGKNAAWEDLAFDHGQDYTHCPTTPAVIPAPVQRLARYLDRIDGDCKVAGNRNCARVLFKAADIDGDGEVTALELKRGLVSAALLAAMAEGTLHDAAAIDAAAAAAKAMADDAAPPLVAARDKNGDGVLDYNECAGAGAAGVTPALAKIIDGLGRIFPAFRLAALKL